MDMSPQSGAVLLVLLILGLPFGARAQDAQPGAKGNPEASYSLAANGLQVRLSPRMGDKKVAVLLMVRAGSFAEPAGKPHLAHLAEHVIVFGAREGSEEAQAVQRWYEQRKANAETLAPLMYFDLEVDSAELDLALRVQAQRLARAQLSPAVVAREIPRTLAELDFMEHNEQSSTAKMALVAFSQAVLHGKTDVPIRAVTRTFTVDDVRTFYQSAFRPDRALLCVAGEFDVAAAKRSIEKIFGALPKSKDPQPALPKPKAGVRDVRWDLATSNLVIGWPAPPPSDPDHAALSLAAGLLTMRLFSDTQLTATAKLPMATNDTDGFFVVNLQAKNNASLDKLRARVEELVAPLSTPEGLNDMLIKSSALEYAGSLKGIDLDAIPLPQGMSKFMAMANLELQTGTKALVWGDLVGYAKCMSALEPAAVRGAVKRYLDPKAALVVRIEPAR
ncbi:MAG TPA: insulinase family protein [Isosphaeraceae bacterium]|nr:insulinase family protein [Isosphaeraceae bacterium]